MTLTTLADKIRSLLQGEPLRMITLGAIVVIWVVTHGAFAFGLAGQPPAFDLILAAVTGAIAALNEAIRMFVYSPATVAVLQDEAAVQPAWEPLVPEPAPVVEPDVVEGDA